MPYIIKTRESIKSSLGLKKNDLSLIIEAYDKKILLGSVFLYKYFDNNFPFASLDSLYVNKKYRNLGIGSKLVKEAQKIAKYYKLDIWLFAQPEINIPNMDRTQQEKYIEEAKQKLINFYKRLGFKSLKRRNDMYWKYK